MIEIKIGDLVNSTTILQKLANMNLKAKLAWKVSRLLKAADAEIQDFNKTRMEVIRKYGTKDENDELITDENGNCKILDENTAAFSQELNELIEQTVEINVNPININELDELDFTPAEMTQLDPFLEE